MITYENATTVRLNVTSEEFELVTLEPGEISEFQVIRRVLPDRVRAYDESGALVFDRTYTWEDLERAGWRVVITDQGGASPTPGSTDIEVGATVPP